MEEKYGAQFSESNPDLSPNVESQWLNYVEEFERQFEHARRISVREFLGYPKFKLRAEIPSDQLESELDSVLEYLQLHGISVDFLSDVSDEEAYRFITEELLDEEIDDIRIEGMMHCFIYEEFYPNLELDAKQFAEHFLWDLFERREEWAARGFSDDEAYDRHGQPIGRDQISRLISQWYQRYPLFSSRKHELVDCTPDGDYATVRFRTEWTGLDATSNNFVTHSGESVLRMKKSPYGGCDVVQAVVVGWEDSPCSLTFQS